jgi:hypothetical protein
MPTDQPDPDRPDSVRGAGRDADRGAGRDADRDAGRGADRGADRDAGRDAGRGPDGGADASASRAAQVAEHGRYRQAVDAAYRAAADRNGWAEALPGLRAAWDGHKERYPDRERAAPRDEPDGSWTCGQRRLDPEQNAEAGKAHADLADEADREILPALRRVEAADPERRLAGLEHMVKGADRLKEKLADAWNGRPGLTVWQVLSAIPDAVRSTLTYSSEHYAEGVQEDIDRLKAEGFELVRLKNLWHADQYKGINSQWLRSETGTRFEMQFHTPESLEAKELTHEAYERIRADAALPADQQDLEEQGHLESFQRRVNTLVAIPPETDLIKDFPERKDG